MNSIGFDAINKYEQELLEYGTQELLKINELKIYGTSKKTSVIRSEEHTSELQSR